MTKTNQDKMSMRERFEKGMYLSSAGDRRRAISFFESELKSLRDELEKYQCNFNWDFEKNTAKHKSYIALDDVLKLIDERMGK